MNTTRLTNAIKNSEQLIADEQDHYDYDCIQTPGNYNNNNDKNEIDAAKAPGAPVKLKLLLPLSEELDIVPINLKAQFEDEVTDEDEDEGEVKEQEPDEYVSRFNNLYNTNFNKHELFILQGFAKDEHLLFTDAIDYIQDCHYCGSQLGIFGNAYCNKRCCELVEDYRYPCHRGINCLICHGYPVSDVDTDHCFWGPDCDKCAAYTGKKEDQFCLFCVECIKPMTDHEGYVSNKELFCNLCILKQDLSDENDTILEEDENTGQKVNNGWLNEETGLFHIGDWVNGSFIPYMDDVRNIEYFGLDEDDKSLSVTSSNEVEEAEDAVTSLEEDDEKDNRKRKYSSNEENDEDEYTSVDDDSEMNFKRIKQCDDMDISSNEYDYCESVVDDSSEIDEEEDEEELQTHYDIISQLQNENALLRRALSSQTAIVFPDGYNIGFMMVGGVRYLQVFNGNPIAANNTSLTLADLDCEQSQQDSEYDL
jgi:hypothetical protein